MSMTPPSDSNFAQSAAPPPKQGMSGAGKVLLWLGIGCGGMAILCCGLGVAGIFYFKDYAEKAISQDPDKIREATAQMADIQVPKELSPVALVDMTVPFTGQSFMKFVIYGDQPAGNNQNMGNTLMLASFGEMFAGQNQKQMQDQMEQSMRQQGMAHDRPLTERESHQKTIKVRGNDTTFNFATGKDASGKLRREVTGAFQGKSGGMVMLMMMVDGQKFSEERIVEMIQTIK